MKRNHVLMLVLLFILLVDYSLNAQSLYGYVLEQNSGKIPVRGVQVNGTFGANPVTTKTKGEYMLTFQDARPGKSVTLIVEKQNWVVTDKDKLSANLPEDAPNHPHTIVMCRKDVWEKQNKDFETLLKNYIKKAYEKEKAALNKLDQQNQKKIDSLWEKFENQTKDLKIFVEEYSKTNLDELTGIEKKAFILFKTGRIEECIALRKSLESEKNFIKEKNKQKKLDSERKKIDTLTTISDSTLEFHKRNLQQEGRLAYLQNDMITAEQKFKFLADNDSTDYENLATYAFFLTVQNRYDEAIILNNRALNATKSKSKKADVFNDLGGIYKKMHNYHDAEGFYKTSIYFRQYVIQDDSLNEIKLASTLSDLGTIYEDQNDYPTAGEYYKEAFELLKKHTKDKDNEQLVYKLLSTALDNIGDLLDIEKRYAESKEFHFEELKIGRKLLEKYGDAYEPVIGLALHNLGRVFEHEKNYKAADSFLVKALELRRRLVEKNANAYEPDLAQTLNSIGNIYFLQEKYKLAEDAYLEALNIRRRLSRFNPTANEPEVATELLNLASIYRLHSSFHDAEKAYWEAIHILEKFLDIGIYKTDYCKAVIGLGGLYGQNPNWDDQKINDYFKESQFVDSILSSYPDDDELKATKQDLNKILKGPESREIIKIVVELIKHPSYKERIPYQQQMINVLKPLAAKDKNKYAVDLANAYNDMAGYLLFNKQFEEAEKMAREGLFPTNKDLPDNYSKETEIVNSNLALALLFQGKYNDAEKIYLAFKDKIKEKTMYEDKKLFKQIFLDDLDEMEKAGITNKDVGKIRALLKGR